MGTPWDELPTEGPGMYLQLLERLWGLRNDQETCFSVYVCLCACMVERDCRTQMSTGQRNLGRARIPGELLDGLRV